MQSMACVKGGIEIPLYTGERQTIPFDLQTLAGLPAEFVDMAKTMLADIVATGIGFFTIHGRTLKAGETLRRPGAHIDGSYDQAVFDWGGGGGSGWKVDQDGPALTTAEHERLYLAASGGIILASNYEACNGYVGEIDGQPGVGGDCTHLELPEPFLLRRNTVYYGNNHFVHESLPMREAVHRVFVRINLPEDHIYKPVGTPIAA